MNTERDEGESDEARKEVKHIQSQPVFTQAAVSHTDFTADASAQQQHRSLTDPTASHQHLLNVLLERES